MRINFNELPLQHLAHFNGGEKELQANIFQDDSNKILRATLIPGASVGLHCHATSSETIFFTSGRGIMITDGIEEPVAAGECQYCKKGQSHTLINNGDVDLCFFAVVPQQ